MSLAGIKLKRVDDMDDARKLIEFMKRDHEVICVDTETKGLAWHVSGFTRLVQFGNHAEGWTLGTHLWGGLIEEALHTYQGPVSAHNLKFDQHALDVAGFPIIPRHRAHDTALMYKLLFPLEYAGLKPASNKLIDKNANVASKQLDALMKRMSWNWETVPYECLGYSVYGALDTVLGARLYSILLPMIRERGLEAAYEREMSTSHIMFETEKRGMRVDLEYTDRLNDRYHVEMEDLLTKIQFFGVQNPNSGAQIEAALRIEGWEPMEFTDTGRAVTAKRVLEKLDHEVAGLINEYKWRERFAGYTTKILNTHDNGIVYPSINTFEARTGRMSIGSDKKEKGTDEVVSLPWQQIPHTYEVRRCVLPRYGGFVLRPADYDSQELRVTASLANENGLIEAIAGGLDMHLYTASQMFGTITDKEDPRRNIAKMTAYLIIYGGGAEKLAANANISESEAQRMIDLYKNTFPAIKAFTTGVIRAGKTRLQREGRAYIETWGGREVETDAQFEYKLSNYIIQGSCADVLKEKLIQLDSAGFTEYIDLPVHDELVMSVPNDQEGDEIAHEIASIMEDHTSFRVPLTVELSKSLPNWGAKYLRSGQTGWDEIQTAEEVA